MRFEIHPTAREEGVMGDHTEIAILAGGCYWLTQELLSSREGVISTRAGFTGGENDNPTEEDHPGHAEAVEVIFDPTRLSYEDLLKFFFLSHRADVAAEHVGSDYRSEVFYTTDEQRRIAEDMVVKVDAARIWPGKIVTAVTEAGPFWAAPAEEQNYLRRYPNTPHFL